MTATFLIPSNDAQKASALPSEDQAGAPVTVRRRTSTARGGPSIGITKRFDCAPLSRTNARRHRRDTASTIAGRTGGELRCGTLVFRRRQRSRPEIRVMELPWCRPAPPR
jgi:hypothetical protein